ncbi:hypothetical protein KDA00_00415 [Candidatus Saccharibacteria bacterium]|nr:hypothetical protein [Candidatus Saccharibacteria bacterium]
MSKINIKLEDERGMIAITVTVIIIAIVSLITIGFAAVIRRDQRQSLDRQLSTQAYYAAESGINDAIEWVKAGNTSEISTCGSLPVGFPGGSNLGPGVEYSCLLVDPTPDKLIFDPLGTDRSVIVPIDGNADVTSIKISWQRKEGGNQFLLGSVGGAKHNLLSQNEWDTYNSPPEGRTSLLRVDLIPASSLDRANLTGKIRTFFLYPQHESTSGPNAVNYEGSEANQQLFIDGKCNTSSTPQYCNVSLDSLGVSGSGDFYLRIRSIYASSIVTVTAFAGGNQVELSGAQALIDVTGKAADVVRRLQVTVPIKKQFDYPEFAIETTDTICKRLNVWPSTASGSAGADYEPIPGSFNPNVNNSQNQNICNPTQP